MTTSERPLFAAGLALGIGLGGFFDGIAFHQILQLHNMLSAPGYYPKVGVDAETALVHSQINMLWDGLFHALTWTTTLIGVGLLWRAVRLPGVPLRTPVLVGSMLAGWGLFNLVEGVIDHHLLHVHHVVEGPNHLVYDVLFLLSGVILISGGLFVASRRERPQQ